MAVASGQPEPLTPPAIYDMMLAYKTTALLGAALELGVFDALAGGAMGPADAADRLGLDKRSTALLFRALAAVSLLVTDDGEAFRLGAGVGSYLVRGQPGYIGGMFKVMASRWEWDAMRRLPEAVRYGGAVIAENAETPGYAYWEDFATHAGAVAVPTAEFVARELAPWASARDRLHVLDMACGHGLYGYTLAVAQPHARIWSLDWPNVLEIALSHARRLGVTERVTTIPGDMFEVELGGPYDVVMVTNVLHHFCLETSTLLLRRAAQALTPGGKLVIVGFAIGDGRIEQNAAAHLFSILMLIWTSAGEVHHESAYLSMLKDIGCTDAQVHHVPALPLRVIIAERQ
jgi:cyclopropane fatty-acyl-phospholipid synthase-like methyltransferase